METPTKQILLANYGNMKLARYLVRSYDDFVDVCHTVARQVLKCAERKQVFNLFNTIECTFTSVPNTLTSLIVGFTMPEKILSRQSYRSRPARDVEIRVPATHAPKYRCLEGQTLFSARISCFFDLYLLHRFIREAMNLPGEGMKLITSKRQAQITVSRLSEEQGGYRLKVAFPCECDVEKLVQMESHFLKQAMRSS